MAKIDEQTLKDAVARGIPRSGGYTLPPPSSSEDSEEDNVTKRGKCDNSIDEYKTKYFAKTDHSARQLIYVSEEVHESLSNIVKGIGDKKATIGSYVENILRYHLSEHKEMLNGVHKRKYKSPIGW